MGRIKAYTDLSQSKILSKILSFESADMYYDDIIDIVTGELFIPDDGSTITVGKGLSGSIAAWSLSALLGVLPFIDFTTPQLVGTPKTLYRCMYNDDLKSHAYDNPVDACYNLILKLNELKML